MCVSAHNHTKIYDTHTICYSISICPHACTAVCMLMNHLPQFYIHFQNEQRTNCTLQTALTENMDVVLDMLHVMFVIRLQ